MKFKGEGAGKGSKSRVSDKKAYDENYVKAFGHASYVRRPKLVDIPEEHRNEAWIKSEIKYESAKGIHTYHQCDCEQSQCRSTYCIDCWKHLLNKVKNREEF